MAEKPPLIRVDDRLITYSQDAPSLFVKIIFSLILVALTGVIMAIAIIKFGG